MNAKRRSKRPPRRKAAAPAARTSQRPAASSAPHRPPTSGLAPGMQALNTYLAVANVGATMDFLERTFGFARGVTLPDVDGQIRYAEMRHGDAAVMLIRKGDEATATGGAAAVYTYVDDVDRATARARESGAGVGDVEDKPWGDRVAVVTDPDGYRWILATFKKLVPFS